jgi:spectinomycin phosphotransferase
LLEKPDIEDEKIIACLREHYGLPVVRVAFLPIGADPNTAVYRAVSESENENDTAYFVKLRGDVFDETSVALPKFLSDRGLAQIIAPRTTGTGQLWAVLNDFKMILYPFVAGHDGFSADLSERQWVEFGATLRTIHGTRLPRELLQGIQMETYSSRWRETVQFFLERIEHEAFDDPAAIKLAAFLRDKRRQLLDLVRRAGQLGLALQAQSPEFVLCHSDIHEGNILIDTADNLHIVDWDNPILAPKERDLMFVGGGIGGVWNKPEQAALFYRGYGQTHIDLPALAYYRYERIVQDIATFCEQIFLTDEGGEDREQALQYVAYNFLPGGTLEIACLSDKAPGER